MGREWSYDDIVRKGQEETLGAFSHSTEDELIAREDPQPETELEQYEPDEIESECAQRKAICDLIDRFYGKIPRTQYKVLCLRYQCRMSIGQIAQILDMRPGTVCTNKCRGLQTIRTLMLGKGK
jgi:DNA-directed RNA polymerase specialized sigma24 family protein